MTKVASVEPIPVSYPEPNDFDALRHLCLVKITTDDGLVGWGESITQFPEASLATQRIVEGMAERVVGRDPVHTGAIWRALKDQSWWYGYGGGIASNAIAAIDIALWDLKGKVLGRSVLDLLGGPFHERLPAVASSHAHYEDIGRMVEEAQEWLAPGLHGVKVGFGKRGNARLGYEHDRDVEYMRRMREGLGPDPLIMIDCGFAVKWDISAAIRRVQAFEEHGLHWIEEPLGAWDPEGYANLRAKTTALIAYGEREWNVEGYERVLATGTVDVVGVDPGRAEGLTGFKKVTERVEAYRRQSNAHTWSSAIVSAASLAISFSTPSAKLFELKPLRNPMQHDLVTEPFEHVGGWMEPRQQPGLGIEVIEEVVDHYRSERVEARA
ncbi:MAG: mandelate racemase/muconate lactonizing enzyme family protein [Candidatus Limnocylindrales bacterium]